ncbi:MAG: glycosyltransferase [Bacteroidetes bacterium]|nr:glycosyltransferase [Bacteroidota bacterium]
MMTVMLLLLAAFYAARLGFFYLGSFRQRALHSVDTTTLRVSVIVPARNEERNLPRCIEALQRANYPADKVEFIIVNDRSTDSTASVAEQLTSGDAHFRIVHKTDASVHANLRGKPGAIQEGIDRATGDVILCTDADCSIHPNWISAMAAPFGDPSVGMVCGFTTIKPTGLFAILQDVEWMYSQAMAKGGVGNNVPLGCYGNNMAIRRSTYDAVGGYAAIPFSITEDLALLQHIADHGKHVIYQCTHEATVETLPCTTLHEYLTQRQRWARGGTALGSRALIFVLSSVAVWVGIVTSVVQHNMLWLSIFVVLRVVGDSVLVGIAAVRMRRYALLPFILPSIIMLMMTELSAPFLSLRKNVTWKGQVFQT